MASYNLTNKANEDLDKIWDYSYEEWNEEQADKYYFELIDCFQFLADNPTFGRNYEEIDEELFGYLINKHIVFFQKITREEILVIRILHTSTDLKNRIKE